MERLGLGARGRLSPPTYKKIGGTTMPTNNKSEIVIFKTTDEKISVDVCLMVKLSGLLRFSWWICMVRVRQI